MLLGPVLGRVAGVLVLEREFQHYSTGLFGDEARVRVDSFASLMAVLHHQDPAFWFQGPRQRALQKSLFAGSFCLCGLCGPLCDPPVFPRNPATSESRAHKEDSIVKPGNQDSGKVSRVKSGFCSKPDCKVPEGLNQEHI